MGINACVLASIRLLLQFLIDRIHSSIMLWYYIRLKICTFKYVHICTFSTFLGVLLLVLLYTALGSIVFVTLEGELEEATALETAVAASKPYPRTELANAEIRSR